MPDASQPAETDDPAGARILCAEDDPLVRLTISSHLTEMGHTVTAVEDGRQAWEQLERCDYDLLITDNRMPVLSGVELISRMRLSGMTLPIIVATGDVEFFTESRRRFLRIAAVVQKPFSWQHFSHVVAEVLCAGHAIPSVCKPLSSFSCEAREDHLPDTPACLRFRDPARPS